MGDASGNVGWALQRAAALYPDAAAVVDGEVRLSYRELSRRVDGLGGSLQSMGLRAGEVVAVLSLNSLQHLECWLAVPSAGLVLNDLNIRLGEDELAYILDDSQAAALVVDDHHLGLGERLVGRCRTVRHLIWTGSGVAPGKTVGFEELTAAPARPSGEPSGDDLAGIFYTGGTTGAAKGVMLTHANLVANAKHVLMTLRHTDRDVYLHAGPMFHLADGSQTYALTWAGGTHAIIPSFDPEAVLSAVERHRVTLLLLVPTMINMVINHPGFGGWDLSSLRLLMYGASPMPDSVQRKAMEMFGCEFTQMYGMTEAAPLLTMCSAEDHRLGMKGVEPYATRLKSAGAPVVGVQAEVRRPDGSRADPREVGEIWARGPNVMGGYFNKPAETAAALVGGWYRTGDAAYADENGYLYIVDRVKDMIISGGENVYSAEVENALCSHPAVLEAAVIGVPDEVWGERVHAVVVLAPAAQTSGDELVAHCRGRIAGFKVPRSIELRSEPLPKSGAGKVLKRELREPFWRGKQRQVS